MKKIILAFVGLFLPLAGVSQIAGPEDPDMDTFNTIRQNGVSTIAAFGDTVWISPSLNRNIDNEAYWFTPENADSVVDGIGRVFSLDLGQDTIAAGLGITVSGPDGSVAAGYGFYFSTDGGDNWRFSPFPTDPQPSEECQSNNSGYDPACDISFIYGGETYYRVRNTVREQSPPYSIQFHGDKVLAATWASGLIRSLDFGETWERIILPPTSVTDFNPNNSYEWFSQVSEGTIQRYDPRFDNNLLGFGVLIDSQNRVWFGSADGINISENALTAPTDSISWKHVSFNNTSNGLLANWIISIKEEPETGRIWMTNWIADQPQREGVVYTEDGGETFTQMLIGERINDIGFKDGYVFAAGNNGLFISPNGGDTWIKSPQIKSSNTFIKNSAIFYTVASTTNRVWVGTDDGIASTGDHGESWEITRVNFPLKGGNIHDPEGRDVNTYAYPNPFSNSVHEVVRIKFEVQQQSNVKVRIFDFGMNLVREIEDNSFAPGTYEALWDGYDGKSRKVANAPYIYVIEMDDRKVSGKILVVD